MTAEEVRTYLKSYRNLKDKADYLQNKLINVKAISYRDSPTGSYSINTFMIILWMIMMSG